MLMRSEELQCTIDNTVLDQQPDEHTSTVGSL